MGGSSSKPEVRTVYVPAPRPKTPPKTLTDTPWRYEKQSNLFSKQYEEKLLKDMKDEFSTKDLGLSFERANVLLLGPIRAGKSSFVNSVATVSRGRVADVARAGDAETSYTTTYGKFAPRRGVMKNFCMHDCMGIERSTGGFNVDDVMYLVNGNIPKDFPFNPANPITSADPRFKRDPKEEDKIHCIVYVVDAEALYGDIPKDLCLKIAHLQERLKSSGLPRVMILTKIDKLCSEVSRNVTKTFSSIVVRDMVSKASEVFKLPAHLIHPVQNYNKPDLDHELNVLILLALRQMLNFAEDYVESQCD